MKTPREVFEWYLYQPAHKIGWIDTRDHLERFRHMAQGEILEIGVDQGISTAAWLLGLEDKGGHLTSVDIRPECGEIFKGHPQWTFICGDSATCVPDKDWDIVFIDGDHDYAHVLADMKHVKKVGLLHDICAAAAFPGVRKAFAEWPGRKQILSELSYGLGAIYVD